MLYYYHYASMICLEDCKTEFCLVKMRVGTMLKTPRYYPKYYPKFDSTRNGTCLYLIILISDNKS